MTPKEKHLIDQKWMGLGQMWLSVYVFCPCLPVQWWFSVLKHELDLESAIFTDVPAFFFQSQGLTVSVSLYKVFAIKDQREIGTFLPKKGLRPSVAWEE